MSSPKATHGRFQPVYAIIHPERPTPAGTAVAATTTAATAVATATTAATTTSVSSAATSAATTATVHARSSTAKCAMVHLERIAKLLDVVLCYYHPYLSICIWNVEMN